MSTTVVKDSTSFTLFRAFLTENDVGDEIMTPKRDVPCSDGLQWWMEYSPAGWKEADKGHVSVYLYVNKPGKAKHTFSVDGSSISKTDTTDFTEPLKGMGYDRFASHEELRPLFRNGKLTISCNVDFDIVAPVLSVPRVFQLFHHVPMDIEIVVGSERVQAHKSFLVMLSPVFEAMFAHNTAESSSGKIEITDFDFATVKAALDICYGRQLKELSVEIVINILRFCDKYFLTAIIDEFKGLPLAYLSTENFCLITRYAWDCSRKELQQSCAEYFNNKQNMILNLKDFHDLPADVSSQLLKASYLLKHGD